METKPLHPVNPKTPVTTEQIDFGNTHNSSPRSCVLPPVQGVRLLPSYDFDLPLCVPLPFSVLSIIRKFYPIGNLLRNFSHKKG